MRRLLAAGAKPDEYRISGDLLGAPPLHIAVRRNDAEMVRLLLEYGASMQMIDAEQQNIIDCVLDLADCRPMLRLLFERGLHVDALNASGESMLMSSAWMGDCETLLFLLEQGATVDLTDNRGRTALIFASDGGEAEAAQLLLSWGAWVNARDACGFSPLMAALQMPLVTPPGEGEEETVFCSHYLELMEDDALFPLLRVLLAHGADVSPMDKWGWSPLLFAITCGCQPVAQMLLDAGATLAGLSPARIQQARRHLLERGSREGLAMLEALRP